MKKLTSDSPPCHHQQRVVLGFGQPSHQPHNPGNGVTPQRVYGNQPVALPDDAMLGGGALGPEAGYLEGKGM